MVRSDLSGMPHDHENESELAVSPAHLRIPRTASILDIPIPAQRSSLPSASLPIETWRFQLARRYSVQETKKERNEHAMAGSSGAVQDVFVVNARSRFSLTSPESQQELPFSAVRVQYYVARVYLIERNTRPAPPYGIHGNNIAGGLESFLFLRPCSTAA
jgi:hypothetical protein